MDEKAEHWNQVYQRRAPTEVSWFQPQATTSLELIAATRAAKDAPIIDVGAGSSLLVDGLLTTGYEDITLLDIAESAFVETRHRLGALADAVQFVVSDITSWLPTRRFAVWHDRAVFHFLTQEQDRSRYRTALAAALPPGAHAIIATFAPDGPERCSGLLVRRYSTKALAEEFSGILSAIEDRTELHSTPKGTTQSFTFGLFRRV